jgi:hypothetical protein
VSFGSDLSPPPPRLTRPTSTSLHVGLVNPVKTNKTSATSIYRSLKIINRRFEKILQEFERIQQLDCFRKQPAIKSVELAVKETRAWTMFEILEIVHGREESEWTRFGRRRSHEERSRAKPRRQPTR